jgi:hypothetical protein
MAESPSHKFGQLVGDMLEQVVFPPLDAYCKSQGLYLDFHGRDRPARQGKTVTWTDKYGNEHGLDFVIERSGSDYTLGRPIAFIESAWRRYTKHSRNKAQEIQGALLPLAETYNRNNPFLGAVLAGDFTSASLSQLRSHGFHVLYFPYESVVEAFRSQRFDIAFDESTSDRVFADAVQKVENAGSDTMSQIRARLVQTQRANIDDFFAALTQRLSRHVVRVMVAPLYGRVNEFTTIRGALDFFDAHLMYEGSGEFRRYEIRVEFSNGDKVEASIEAKQKAIAFLNFVAAQ